MPSQGRCPARGSPSVTKIASIPIQRAGTQTFNNLSHYPNTRMISRSDYLRLSMLSLRYRLSSSLLHHLGDVVKYATIALQGSNLFTAYAV